MTKKLDLERTMGELGTPFLKKIIKIKTEKSLSKCRMRTKNHQREMKIWFKQKTKPRMNYQYIGKTLWKKNPIQKIEKTAKTRVKLPHVNKKTHYRESGFLFKPGFLTLI